jgi:hypothetical protein
MGRTEAPHKTNKAWHAAHRMPAKQTLEQRIAWHREHAEQCGCRPIPPSLQKLIRMKARRP